MAPNNFNPNHDLGVEIVVDLSFRERIQWWVCDRRDDVVDCLERVAAIVRGDDAS